jgi:hypothetical protein
MCDEIEFPTGRASSEPIRGWGYSGRAPGNSRVERGASAITRSFLDGNGLNIVEPVELTQGRTAAGRVVNLASWNDEDPPKLAAHEPESTYVVIVLESVH